MKIESKVLVSAAAILIAISSFSPAIALPAQSGKPTDPGKPTAQPTSAANPGSKPSNTPGNLIAIGSNRSSDAPGSGDFSMGKPVDAGKPADTGKPVDAGKPLTNANAVVVENLIKSKKSDLDVEDLSPKKDYIVRFKEDAEIGNEVRALKASKVAVGRTFSHVFKGLVAKMSEKQVATLSKRSTVAAIEADAAVEVFASESSATWGIDRIDQAQLPLSSTFDYTNTGAGVKAYVIDTGIYGANVDFGSRVAAGYTAIADGKGTVDCNGHGTHVSGTIGGTSYGVAKEVTLVPVRVLDCSGSGTYSGVIAGIDWVSQNYVPGTPAVANLSLGGPLSSSLDTAINNLINRGVTVVVAAGNSAADACASSPADVPNAITVAASDRNDQFAYFSNWGSCVDLAAPGVNVTSTWIGSPNATNTISGTSMASPHVAGVVAAMLSTGYRLPTQVASELLAATSSGLLGAVPTATVNKLLFSNPAGWASVTAPTATAPTSPTNVTATAGPRSAIVKWSLPSSDGGSPLTAQTVKVWSGSTLVGTVTAASTATSIVVKGLRQNATYQFSVLASNAIGSSPDSTKSASLTIRK